MISPILGSGAVSSVQMITDDIYYLGADDRRLALFENAHPIPKGIAYNSYLVLDENTVLFDGIDLSVQENYMENLLHALNGRELNYVVVQHVEPDHCSALGEVFSRFPNAKIICSKNALALITQFVGIDVSERALVAKDGFTLDTGKHKFNFYTAPMVHWPEVIVTYDSYSKVLFSADAFGSFGAQNGNLFADNVNYNKDYLHESRRYYSNIVGKYGKQVQALFSKLKNLDIQYICSLHGLIWRKDIPYILDKYGKWSTYTPEDNNSLIIVYGSIYGGTDRACSILASLLSERGIKNIKLYDVSKVHVSEILSEVFRASHIVFASATYNLSIFGPMKHLLHELSDHNVQNRHYSLIENGSWMPAAGKEMNAILSSMPNMTQVDELITIKSRVDENSYKELVRLADSLANSLNK